MIRNDTFPVSNVNEDSLNEYTTKNNPNFVDLIANEFTNRISEARLDYIKRDESIKTVSVIDEEKGININTHLIMLSFDENTKRIFEAILAHFKENGCKYPDGSFTIEYLMSRSRFESARKAITALNEAINILQHTIVYLKSEKPRKSWNDVFNRDIKLFKTLSYAKIKGKKICHYELHDDHFDIMKGWKSEFSVNIRLLKLGLKYNNAYYLGRRLFNHSKMNVNDKNHNFISIQSALESNPTLPRENDANIYNLKKQIQIPFEESLEKLVKEGILTPNYTFYNKKREPLTRSQLCSMNFKCFKNLFLEYELADYEQQRIKNIEYKSKSQKKQQISDMYKKAVNKSLAKLSTRVKKIEKKVS